MQSKSVVDVKRNTSPSLIVRRLKALKKLQLETTMNDAAFFREAHILQATKYHQLNQSVLKRRAAIISGDHEPTDDECAWTSEDELVDVVEENKLDTNSAAQVSGIPDFWRTVFSRVDLIDEMMGPQDEQILRHLEDVTLDYHLEPMSFDILFHFSHNDFFEDSVLTKKYYLSCVPEVDDPFSFDGVKIVKCTGCVIHWKAGRNVTVKSSRGSNSLVLTKSFFNFFNPPPVPDDLSVAPHPVVKDLLLEDYLLAERLRDYVIPRAVLYYTGESALYDEDTSQSEEDYTSDEA